MSGPGNPKDKSGPPAPELLQGYKIEALDHGVLGLDFQAYAQLDGKGPAGTLAELCGNPALVLDAGCGTGRQLYELFEQLDRMYGKDTSGIMGHGLSDKDFSGLSRRAEVNEAYSAKRFTYVVADLTTQPVKPETYSLIYSHEVLMHIHNPGAVILNLWNGLKPGGVMYCNALAGQHLAIAPTLARLDGAGAQIVSGFYRPQQLRTLLEDQTGLADQPRAIYKITKVDHHAWIGALVQKVSADS